MSEQSDFERELCLLLKKYRVCFAEDADGYFASSGGVKVRVGTGDDLKEALTSLKAHLYEAGFEKERQS